MHALLCCSIRHTTTTKKEEYKNLSENDGGGYMLGHKLI